MFGVHHKHSEYNPPFPAYLGVVWGRSGTTLVPPYTHRTPQRLQFQSGKLIQITFLRLLHRAAVSGFGYRRNPPIASEPLDIQSPDFNGYVVQQQLPCGGQQADEDAHPFGAVGDFHLGGEFGPVECAGQRLVRSGAGG